MRIVFRRVPTGRWLSHALLVISVALCLWGFVLDGGPGAMLLGLFAAICLPFILAGWWGVDDRVTVDGDGIEVRRRLRTRRWSWDESADRKLGENWDDGQRDRSAAGLPELDGIDASEEYFERCVRDQARSDRPGRGGDVQLHFPPPDYPVRLRARWWPRPEGNAEIDVRCQWSLLALVRFLRARHRDRPWPEVAGSALAIDDSLRALNRRWRTGRLEVGLPSARVVRSGA